MKVCIAYESKYGNGKKVVEHLQDVLTGKGHEVQVCLARETKSNEMPAADLYIFHSPTHMMSPVGKVKKLLKKMEIPQKDAKYAVTATHQEPMAQTAKKMEAIIQPKGMTKAADGLQVLVKGTKGPLEDGWEEKVEAFASKLTG
jgi:flavodoxin